MSQNKDYLNTYINEILYPMLKEDGFMLWKSKTFIRLEGDFFDVISFQLSQYGTKNFHLHYHKNLQALPEVTLSSYSVGYRISNNSVNGDSTDWNGSSNSNAEDAIQSVCRAYLATIRPWFDSVKTVKDYTFERIALNRNVSINHLEVAVAYALDKKFDVAWWICRTIIHEELSEDKRVLASCIEYLNSDKLEKLKKFDDYEREDAIKFFDSTSGTELYESPYDSIDMLVKSWRDSNISRLKLEKFDNLK